MRILGRLLALVICLPVVGAQTVTLTARHLGGADPGAGTSAPQLVAGDPVTQRNAHVGGGVTASQRPLVAAVTAGGLSLSNGPDTSKTVPAKVCYAASVRTQQGHRALLPGFSCIQLASAASKGADGTPWCTTAGRVTACNPANYAPNLPVFALQQYGPPEASATIENVLLTVLPPGKTPAFTKDRTKQHAIFDFPLGTYLSGSGATGDGSHEVGASIQTALPQSLMAVSRPNPLAQSPYPLDLNNFTAFNVMSFVPTGLCTDEAINNAIASRGANGGHVTLPVDRNCVYSGSSLVINATFGGPALDFDGNNTTLTMTGDGGGSVCGPGQNGVIQIRSTGYLRIHGVFFKFTNPNAKCWINYSLPTSSGPDPFIQGLHLDHNEFHGIDGTTSAVAFWTARSGNWGFEDNVVYNGVRNSIVASQGVNGAQLVDGEQTDVVTIRHNTFGPTSGHDFNVYVYGPQAVNITGNNFENDGVYAADTGGYNIGEISASDNSFQDGCDNLFEFHGVGVANIRNNFAYSGTCASTTPFVLLDNVQQATVSGNQDSGAGVGVSLTNNAHAVIFGNAFATQTYGISGGGFTAFNNTLSAATPFNLTGGGNQIWNNAERTSSGVYYAGLEKTTGSHIADSAAFTQAMASASVVCLNNTIESPASGLCSPTLVTKATQIIGPRFTIDGGTCAAKPINGGATAGTFAAGAAGTCTGNLTMGGGVTAPHDWHCSFNNRANPDHAMGVVAANPTTVSFRGTANSGDVIDFACTPF